MASRTTAIVSYCLTVVLVINAVLLAPMGIMVHSVLTQPSSPPARKQCRASRFFSEVMLAALSEVGAVIFVANELQMQWRWSRAQRRDERGLLAGRHWTPTSEIRNGWTSYLLGLFLAYGVIAGPIVTKRLGALIDCDGYGTPSILAPGMTAALVFMYIQGFATTPALWFFTRRREKGEEKLRERLATEGATLPPPPPPKPEVDPVAVAVGPSSAPYGAPGAIPYPPVPYPPPRAMQPNRWAPSGFWSSGIQGGPTPTEVSERERTAWLPPSGSGSGRADSGSAIPAEMRGSQTRQEEPGAHRNPVSIVAEEVRSDRGAATPPPAYSP